MVVAAPLPVGISAMGLDTLRRRLADVDRQILERVARRQRLVAAIGEVKRRSEIPLRDFTQEKEVLARARRAAADLGLAPRTATALLRVLIDSSLILQERERVARHGDGSGRRVLVIGGAGRMGGWFVRFLASQGYQVEIADPAVDREDTRSLRDWRASDLEQEIIVVAATLRRTGLILEELAQRRPPGLVFDIGSLKGPLRTGLEALATAGVRVTSLHPMFGPDLEMLSGRHVIFVDVGVARATQQARALFEATAVEQVEMDLEGHDRLIAWVLGLSHALNIAFTDVLRSSGEVASLLVDISSTTFDGQLRLATAVAHDNPHLYFEIQSLNPYGGEPLEALQRSVTELRDVIDSGDEKRFTSMMRQGRRYLENRHEPGH